MRLIPINPITLARCRRALEEDARHLRLLIALEYGRESGPVVKWRAELDNINHDIAHIDAARKADDDT